VTVTATISSTYNTLFLRTVGLNTVTVAATASAIITGGTISCVFCVLSSNANPALNIENNGAVHLTNGGLIVNSSANGGLTVNNNGVAQAQAIGIVGNDAIGNNGVVSPSPSHISAITDPFAGMTLPTLPGTNGTSISVPINGSTTLNAGVYNSIVANNNGTVILNSGTYYITNILDIENNSTITANNVLLYFTCGGPAPAVCLNTGQAGGYLNLMNNASITITGPSSGTLKGLSVLYDRHNTSPLYLDNNAGTFSGTIYARSAIMHIQNNANVLSTRAVVGTADVQPNGTATFTLSQPVIYAPPGSPALVR
jgi:hypothetical protein